MEQQIVEAVRAACGGGPVQALVTFLQSAADSISARQASIPDGAVTALRETLTGTSADTLEVRFHGARALDAGGRGDAGASLIATTSRHVLSAAAPRLRFTAYVAAAEMYIELSSFNEALQFLNRSGAELSDESVRADAGLTVRYTVSRARVALGQGKFLPAASDFFVCVMREDVRLEDKADLVDMAVTALAQAEESPRRARLVLDFLKACQDGRKKMRDMTEDSVVVLKALSSRSRLWDERIVSLLARASKRAADDFGLLEAVADHNCVAVLHMFVSLSLEQLSKHVDCDVEAALRVVDRLAKRGVVAAKVDLERGTVYSGVAHADHTTELCRAARRAAALG